MSKIFAVFGGTEHTFSSYISPSKLTRIPQVSGHFKSGSLRRGQHRSNRHSLFRGELERQSAHRQEGRQAGRQAGWQSAKSWLNFTAPSGSQSANHSAEAARLQTVHPGMFVDTNAVFLFRGVLKSMPMMHSEMITERNSFTGLCENKVNHAADVWHDTQAAQH